MKTSVPYSLKKGLAFLGVMALPFAFGGCDKDPVEPNNPDNPNNPQNTYNIEYIYTDGLKFHRVGDTALIPHSAFVDTVAKHGTNAHVKQIHITPDHDNMWSTAQLAQMELYADRLQNMYNSSNSKLSGENTTLELNTAVFNSSKVQNVLHNTLGINLVQR